MKRFTRKVNQNKTLQQLSHRKLKTQQDEVLSAHSQSTTKNRSIDQISLENKVSFPKPSAFLIFTLIRSKYQNNMSTVLEKINRKSQKQKAKLKKLEIILKIDNKINFKLKTQTFYKLKNIINICNRKNKSVLMLQGFAFRHMKKMKSETLLKLAIYTKNDLVEENNQLKQAQAKYQENSLPEEYLKQYRKFVKINPKSNRNFLKNNQNAIELTTCSLLEVLQSKRRKKNIPSDSQIVVTVIKNYIQSFKDLNLKNNNNLNQIKVLTSQKSQIETQLKGLQKEVDSRVKQLKKFDNELAQKTDSVVQSSYSLQSLKNLEKIIDTQIKVCEGKSYNGYQYTSRCNALKAASMFLKKCIEQDVQFLNQKSQGKTNTSRNRPQRSSKNKTQIIEQQTSLEQSDLVDQVSRIIDQLIAEINTQQTFESLRMCASQKNFKSIKKNMHSPQLLKIYKKFQQILQVFCQNKFASYQIQKQNMELKQKLQNQNQSLNLEIKLKTTEIFSLNQKLKMIQSTLRQNELSKLQIMQKIQSEATFKTKQLQKQLQDLNIKFLQKDRKLAQVKDEYKKMRKLIKGSVEKNKQRSDSIQQIINKSLSKSKQIVKEESLKVSNKSNSLTDLTKRKQMNDKLKATKFFDTTPQNKSKIGQKPIKQKIINNQQQKQLQQLANSMIHQHKTKKQQQLNQIINTLKSKLKQAESKSKQNKSSSSMSINKQYILPQNLLTMLYNIMVKIKQLPQKSQIAQQVWQQLSNIHQNCQGVELLMNLQDFSVLWLNDNIKQGQHQNKFKTRLEKHLLTSQRTDRSNRNNIMQTPKRLSRDRNKASQLNKTIKNNGPLY